MSTGRRTRSRFAALLAPLAVAVALGGCGGDDPATGDGADDQLSGYRREPAPSVAEVRLPSAAGGGEVDFVAPEDAVLIVYFGYTSCPDVCPTTMSDLRRALSWLPEDDRSRVEFTMVTVDPARDVPEKLDAYVTTFLPEGRSARTEDDAQLRAAADAFGADYSVTTDDEGEVEVSHTAELYAVDDTGHIVLQWPFGTTAEALAEDLATLLGTEATTTT